MLKTLCGVKWVNRFMDMFSLRSSDICSLLFLGFKQKLKVHNSKCDQLFEKSEEADNIQNNLNIREQMLHDISLVQLLQNRFLALGYFSESAFHANTGQFLSWKDKHFNRGFYSR